MRTAEGRRARSALGRGPAGAPPPPQSSGVRFPGESADFARHPSPQPAAESRGAPPRADVPGSMAIETLPGAPGPPRRDRSPEGPRGACKKAKRNLGGAPEMSSPGASPLDEGKRNPCPGSGTIVSTTLPARRARRRSHADPDSRSRGRTPGARNGHTAAATAPGPAPRPHSTSPRVPAVSGSGVTGLGASLPRAQEAGWGHQGGAAFGRGVRGAGVERSAQLGPYPAPSPTPAIKVAGDANAAAGPEQSCGKALGQPARCAPPNSLGFHATLLGESAGCPESRWEHKSVQGWP